MDDKLLEEINNKVGKILNEKYVGLKDTPNLRFIIAFKARELIRMIDINFFDHHDIEIENTKELDENGNVVIKHGEFDIRIINKEVK